MEGGRKSAFRFVLKEEIYIWIRLIFLSKFSFNIICTANVHFAMYVLVRINLSVRVIGYEILATLIFPKKLYYFRIKF